MTILSEIVTKHMKMRSYQPFPRLITPIITSVVPSRIIINVHVGAQFNRGVTLPWALFAVGDIGDIPGAAPAGSHDLRLVIHRLFIKARAIGESMEM
ncbi:hypothetical protein SODG_003501 [Sodalis praecaptivus]